MNKTDEYRTVEGRSEGIFKDRGSKFIGIALPVTSPGEATMLIEKIRKEFHDARHHCFAFRIGVGGETWRVNDDGEPSGSAGNPILGQLKSFDLTNVLVVVVRYFGGTLLGVGGLINAYRSAAREALSSATIKIMTDNDSCIIEFPYSEIGKVMDIIKEESITQVSTQLEMTCRIELNFRKSITKRVLNRFNKVNGLKAIMDEND